MNATAPSLTPPNKDQKAPKAPKVAKPAGEKKDRAPRKDYGFHADSVIRLTDKEVKYRGQRKDYYDLLKAANGKKVAQFLESAKDRKDPPRGWLRFFVEDGAATLDKPAV
jgi:hypothetical protein